ncbi:MAG: HEAT repeat domain-containing protein [Verrucomicrobia bacterium]|nr:HEAT repeat domain-containing protein [Verrucomicrobiota bacterium]
MGPLITFLCLATTSLQWMAGHGQIAEAVEQYRESYPQHDFEVLREVGENILLSSLNAKDPQDQLMAAFGAGIAGDTHLLPIFAAGVQSPHPALQAACVNLLTGLEDDDADALLFLALSSDFLLIRLEALHALALRKHQATVLQLDVLMAKVPPEIRPIFPQLYVLLATPEADRALMRFLSDPDPVLRRAAIDSLAKGGRDDFLPEIRRLSLQLDPLQQEICAFAFGALRDGASLERLEALSLSSSPTLQIAALQALYLLGKEEALSPLKQLALKENLFAIAALGEVEGGEEVLVSLLRSNNYLAHLNAGVALLLRQDPRSVAALIEMLHCDPREKAYTLQSSRTGAVGYLRTLSAPLGREEGEMLVEISQRLREAIVVEAAQLPQSEFLQLATSLFQKRQDDLVPILVSLLENMGTPEAIALLKRESEHIGAPLIRTYCTLALFRLGVEGPYQEQLLAYIRSKRGEELIQLRPLLPWNKRKHKTNSPYELNPNETSRLLLEAFESLAERQDKIAVDALLDAIAYGNPHNRYALTGLLIRIIQ